MRPGPGPRIVTGHGVRARLLALLALATLAGCASVDEADSLTLRQFERVAFSSEIGGEGREGRLVKWTDPVRVSVVPRGGGAAYRDAVARQVERLAAVTGHPMRMALPHESPGNLHVRFTERLHVATLAGEDAPCYVRVVSRGGRIVWGAVYISPETPLLVAHCLAEEMSQAMGLLDDSDLLLDSIFNDDSHRPGLSAGDELLLRLLYHPRLRPGMERERAMEVAAEVLEEIRGARPTYGAR